MTSPYSVKSSFCIYNNQQFTVRWACHRFVLAQAIIYLSQVIFTEVNEEELCRDSEFPVKMKKFNTFVST